MKKVIITILKLFLAIAILIFVIYKLNVSYTDIFNSIKSYEIFAITLFFPTIVTTFISINRWKTFLSMVGVSENLWHLAKINLVSTFLGFVLPSSQGFDVLRIYEIEKAHPHHRGKVGGTVFVERLLGLICLLLISTVSWIFVGNKDSILSILLLFVIVICIVFVILNNRCYNLLQFFLHKIPFCKKVWSYLGKLYKGLHTFPFNKDIVWSILLILLLQLTNIFVVALLFESCGCHIPFIYHLCYQPLISVLTMLPITFGGIGIREGGFAFFYTQMGVDNSVIISVSLLYYLVISIIPAIVGGIIYLCLALKNRSLASK